MKSLRPRVREMDVSIAKAPPKEADPYYGTQQHRDWRETVLRRAGYRCEWTDNGMRCSRRAPEYQLYADHIKERSDGGHDTGAGQALCAVHHGLKTKAERNKRFLRS